MPSPTVWLTAREAGEFLKRSPRQVTQLAREGVLPGHQHGSHKHWRFNQQEIDDWQHGRKRPRGRLTSGK